MKAIFYITISLILIILGGWLIFFVNRTMHVNSFLFFIIDTTVIFLIFLSGKYFKKIMDKD